MFYADFYIDSIQNAKKTMVTTLVQDKEVKDSMHKFIDSQTQFAKVACQTTTDLSTKLYNDSLETMKKVQNFDFGKLWPATK